MSETNASLSEDADVASTMGETIADAELEDLQMAVLVLKHLKKENQQLAKNFENLKGIHLEVVTKHRQLGFDYENLKQERVAVEQQYQQLCESWRAELEEKQRQFEQARSQILEPRDLNLLRVQLLEEVEAPFKAKCEAIAKEAEAAQKQFIQLRREHEALQNSLRGQELQQQNEVQLLQGQLDVVQQALHDKSRSLETAHGRVQQLEQQLRQAQQKREETALQLHFARDEAAELRQAKEAAVVEKEQLAVRLERRSQQLQAEVAELQKLVDSLTRKNRHLADELAESTRSQEATHTQLLTLQAANSSLSGQLVDVQAAAGRERKLLADKAAAAEHAWNERIQELLAQVLQKERQLAHITLSEQQALRQAESDAAEQVAAAKEAAAAQQREAAAKMLELTSKLEAAEASAAGFQSKLLETQNTACLEAQQLQSKLQEAERQLDLLRHRLADSVGQQQALQGISSQLETAAEPGLAAKTQTEARCVLIEQQCQQLEKQLAVAKSQLADLQMQHDDLKKDFEGRIAAVQQAASAEREALLAKNAAKIRKLQEAAKEQVRSLRTKLKASRAASEALHSELSALKISLHEQEAEMDALCRRSVERISPADHPARFVYDSPSRVHGTLAAGSVAAVQSPVRTSLASAFAGVRQRQQQYLEAAAATPVV